MIGVYAFLGYFVEPLPTSRLIKRIAKSCQRDNDRFVVLTLRSETEIVWIDISLCVEVL